MRHVPWLSPIVLAVGAAAAVVDDVSAARVGGCLLVPLLVLAFLRLLSAGRPRASTLVLATARGLVPAALAAVAAAVWPAGDAAPFFAVVAAGALLGVPVALFTLRAQLRADRLAPIGAPLGVLGALSCLLLVAAAGGATARFHAEERAHEEAALASPDPAPWRLESAVDLGPENALPVDRPYRDVRWRASVVLEEGSILELRLRGGPRGAPVGVALLLSADPRLASGFFEEGRIRFERCGAPSGVVPANRAVDVVVTARGRSFEAALDGVGFATGACRRHARGPLTALAMRGRATVLSSHVEPIGPDAAPAHEAAPSRPEVPAGPDRVPGASAAALFVLLFAATLRRRGKVGVARAFATVGLATLPLSVHLGALDPAGPIHPFALGAPVAVSAALLLLLPAVQAPAVGHARRVVLGALVLSSAVATLLALVERSWPPSEAEKNALGADAWEGARLERDLVPITHPLSRRWQHYLGRHEFRGRRVAPQKEPGTTRVLFLGSSSTYGYGVEVPYAFHLERRLNARGHTVEAVVGAVEAGAAARLHVLLESTLLPFRPDVLCLSLGYNDAVVLAQLDERAYLRRVTAPGHRRTLLARLSTRVSQWWAGRRLAAAMAAGTPAAYDALGEEGDRPADRFERILRDFAATCRAHGIDLVLVKEPFDPPRTAGLRPQEHFAPRFREAMDRVAAEYDLVTVDPTPVLETHGGTSLFLDPVHPTEEGHERMAEALLPSVEAVIEARLAKAAGR